MIVASPRGKTKGPASRVPPGGGPKLSLTERVYAALKDIITGELMPGQAFTENDLAHRLLYGEPHSGSRSRCPAASRRISPHRGQPRLFRYSTHHSAAGAVGVGKDSVLPGRRWKIRGFYRGRHRLPSRYCATHPHALLARAVSQMRAQTERIMFAARGLDRRAFLWRAPRAATHGHSASYFA